jgi:hypothetical protein
MAARIASSSGLAKDFLQNVLGFLSRHWFMEHPRVIAQQTRLGFDVFDLKVGRREINSALSGLPGKDFAVGNQIGDDYAMRAQVVAAWVDQQVPIFEIAEHSAGFEPPHRLSQERNLRQARLPRFS